MDKMATGQHPFEDLKSIFVASGAKWSKSVKLLKVLLLI
jgi:hypothetical protein